MVQRYIIKRQSSADKESCAIIFHPAKLPVLHSELANYKGLFATPHVPAMHIMYAGEAFFQKPSRITFEVGRLGVVIAISGMRKRFPHTHIHTPNDCIACSQLGRYSGGKRGG